MDCGSFTITSLPFYRESSAETGVSISECFIERLKTQLAHTLPASIIKQYNVEGRRCSKATRVTKSVIALVMHDTRCAIPPGERIRIGRWVHTVNCGTFSCESNISLKPTCIVATAAFDYCLKNLWQLWLLLESSKKRRSQEQLRISWNVDIGYQKQISMNRNADSGRPTMICKCLIAVAFLIYSKKASLKQN